MSARAGLLIALGVLLGVAVALGVARMRLSSSSGGCIVPEWTKGSPPAWFRKAQADARACR